MSPKINFLGFSFPKTCHKKPKPKKFGSKLFKFCPLVIKQETEKINFTQHLLQKYVINDVFYSFDEFFKTR